MWLLLEFFQGQMWVLTWSTSLCDQLWRDFYLFSFFCHQSFSLRSWLGILCFFMDSMSDTIPFVHAPKRPLRDGFLLGVSQSKIGLTSGSLVPDSNFHFLSFWPGWYCLSGGSVGLRTAVLSLCLSSPVLPPLGPTFFSKFSLLILISNYVDCLLLGLFILWFLFFRSVVSQSIDFNRYSFASRRLFPLFFLSIDFTTWSIYTGLVYFLSVT